MAYKFVKRQACEFQSFTTYSIVGMDDKRLVIEETPDRSALHLKIVDKDGEKEIRFMSPHWEALHNLKYNVSLRDAVEEAKELLNGKDPDDIPF